MSNTVKTLNIFDNARAMGKVTYKSPRVDQQEEAWQSKK